MLRRYWSHLWNEMSATGRRTFPWDLTRGAASGAFATIQTIFALAVAIKYFDATTTQKSVIMAANALGLLLSLAYAAWSPVLARKTWRAALPTVGVACGLFIAALAHNAAVFTVGTTFFGICATLPLPIMTGIYRDNYRGSVRGQVMGISFIVASLVGLGAQFGCGVLLDRTLENYRAIFACMAGLALLAGFAILRMPGGNGNRDDVSANPLASFGAIRENPVFGYVLMAWFLFGFANLLLMPQRIEYLADPRYGIGLTAGQIAFIIGGTTEAVRLIVTQVWARLFDRFNFIKLRIVLVLMILVSIAIYYNTTSIPVIFLATVLLAAAHGGGSIAWTLWVTKFSPPHETARYMSVHTFLTGVRGAMAPFAGYFLVEHLGIRGTALFSCVLIALSLVILWRIRDRALRSDQSSSAIPAPGAVAE